MHQQGRLLTLLALYHSYTGDAELLLTHSTKISGVIGMLRQRRNQSLALPTSDYAWGMPTGNDEADSGISTFECMTTVGGGANIDSRLRRRLPAASPRPRARPLGLSVRRYRPRGRNIPASALTIMASQANLSRIRILRLDGSVAAYIDPCKLSRNSLLGRKLAEVFGKDDITLDENDFSPDLQRKIDEAPQLRHRLHPHREPPERCPRVLSRW